MSNWCVNYTGAYLIVINFVFQDTTEFPTDLKRQPNLIRKATSLFTEIVVILLANISLSLVIFSIYDYIFHWQKSIIKILNISSHRAQILMKEPDNMQHVRDR